MSTCINRKVGRALGLSPQRDLFCHSCTVDLAIFLLYHLPSLPFDHHLKAQIHPNNPKPQSSSSTSPTLSNLQTQLHDTQSFSLTIHIGKIHALEGDIAEHNGFKCEVGLLRAVGGEGSCNEG
jgi:hypothetical protein